MQNEAKSDRALVYMANTDGIGQSRGVRLWPHFARMPSEDGAKWFVVTSTQPLAMNNYVFALMETAT